MVDQGLRQRLHVAARNRAEQDQFQQFVIGNSLVATLKEARTQPVAMAGVMLLVATQFKNPLYAMLAVGFASFGNDLALPGAWGACMDVGGRHTGSLSGSMNMMGNAGGALAPMIVPLVLKATNDNWNANFWMFAIVYFLGAVCWMFIDPVTPLEQQVNAT